MTPTDRDIQILRAISVSGAVTASELEDAMPALGSPKKTIERLWSYKYLDRELVPAKQAIYTVAAKGRRFLMNMEPGDRGQMPQPRTAPPTEPYTGERNTVHRPGAMDAFSLRSRVGDSTVERKRPALIGGRAMEPVGVGRA